MFGVDHTSAAVNNKPQQGRRLPLKVVVARCRAQDGGGGLIMGKYI